MPGLNQRNAGAACGPLRWRYGLSLNQRLELLSDLEVQLCDPFVELALAAILGAARQIKVFLGVAESGDQLGLGVDHHEDNSRRCWRIVSATQSPCPTIKPSLAARG